MDEWHALHRPPCFEGYLNRKIYIQLISFVNEILYASVRHGGIVNLVGALVFIYGF